MACARDGFSNAQIHSLETNGGRGTDTRDLVYSTSLFSPVPKRLVTITCSIQTPGGIVAKKPQHAQNNQRSQQDKQGSSKSAAVRRRVGTPRIPQQRPHVPGVRAAISFLPVQPRRYGRARLGPVRLCLHLRRCYVDHPSFGMAIISRVLDAHGYKVGIICQPDWTDPASITVLGEPRLAFSSAPATWTPWSTTIR